MKAARWDDLLRRMGSAKIELIILNACLTEKRLAEGVPLAVGWSTKAIAVWSCDILDQLSRIVAVRCESI